MKRLAGMACALIAGLVAGTPAAADAETHAGESAYGLHAVTGEPAPGGNAVVRYWGSDAIGWATHFVGVGIPGATVEVTAPGLDAVIAKVEADGRWNVALDHMDDDAPVAPWTATISQQVNGSTHDTQRIDVDPKSPRSAVPGGFAITEAACYLGSETFVRAGEGRAGSIVRVSGLGAPKERATIQTQDVVLGQFTVPGDGSWMFEVPLEGAAPVLFDYYVNGVWQGGTLHEGGCDCRDGNPPRTATRVTLAPISDVPIATPSSSPSPTQAPSTAPATPNAAESTSESAVATFTPSPVVQASSGGVPVWIWIVIGAAVVVAGGVATWLIRRHSLKDAAAAGDSVEPGGPADPGGPVK